MLTWSAPASRCSSAAPPPGPRCRAPPHMIRRVAAAAAQVRIRPAQAAQVGGVIGQPQIRLFHPGTAYRARLPGWCRGPPSAPGPAAAPGRGSAGPARCSRESPGRGGRRRYARRPAAAPSGRARPGPGCPLGRRRPAGVNVAGERVVGPGVLLDHLGVAAPTPSRNRPGKRSSTRRNDAAASRASYCHMLTMPVATIRVFVAARHSSAAARSPRAEPSHRAPNPRSSMVAASSGVSWRSPRQIPNRPRWSRAC